MSDTAKQFDFLFQGKVIALLIKDNEFLSRYGSIVLPEYFSDVHHQMLCEMVNEYWTKYSDIPTIEFLVEEIEKQKDAERKVLLASCLEEVIQSDLSDAPYYAEKVVAFCKRQALLLSLRQSAQQLKDGNFDSIIPLIEKATMVGQMMDSESMGIRYWKDFDRTDLHKDLPKIPTMLGDPGIGGIDEVLQGGLEQENVGMVQMPTGKGKSVFLLNVAGNAVVQGYNVAYISLELSERKMLQRFNMFFSGLGSKELAVMTPKEIHEHILAGYKNWDMGNLLVKTFPMRSATIRDIESFLKAFAAKEAWYPDLVIIDYLDIIKPPIRRSEEWLELKDISEEMKAFAQRRQIPVWTASQLNRAGAKKKIATNEDSAGAYAKNFAVDVSFTAVPTLNEETEERTAVLFCSKNRQGADQMTLDFEMDLDAMRFIFRPREAKANTAKLAYQHFLASRPGK